MQLVDRLQAHFIHSDGLLLPAHTLLQAAKDASSTAGGPFEVKAWQQCGGAHGCSSTDTPCADAAWTTVVCPKSFVCSRCVCAADGVHSCLLGPVCLIDAVAFPCGCSIMCETSKTVSSNQSLLLLLCC